MGFKEILRNYMEMKGISQTDLADMIGDTQQAISDFLSKGGNPRQKTRQKYFDNLDGFLKYYKHNTSFDKLDFEVDEPKVMQKW